MNYDARKVSLHNRKMLLKTVSETVVIWDNNYVVSYVCKQERMKQTFIERKKKRDARILQEVQNRLESSKKWIEHHSYGDGH